MHTIEITLKLIVTILLEIKKGKIIENITKYTLRNDTDYTHLFVVQSLLKC